MPAEGHLLFPAAGKVSMPTAGRPRAPGKQLKKASNSRIFLIFVVNPRFILWAQSKPC